MARLARDNSPQAWDHCDHSHCHDWFTTITARPLPQDSWHGIAVTTGMGPLSPLAWDLVPLSIGSPLSRLGHHGQAWDLCQHWHGITVTTSTGATVTTGMGPLSRLAWD